MLVILQVILLELGSIQDQLYLILVSMLVILQVILLEYNSCRWDNPKNVSMLVILQVILLESIR
ncbi:hypothetical protein GYY_05560 [Methanococcus maripaludis X1]|uniref:Uncharacterized protein n=1 Tax=Methanococcus maripaludis X1 TaxID=1053692 RepID=G0H096_METMI|nr:hypothetical protein GYY_05560 [Methanococcus maripaludis X1]